MGIQSYLSGHKATGDVINSSHSSVIWKLNTIKEQKQPPVAKMKLWNLLTVYAHYSFGFVAEIALDSSGAIF